MTWLGIRAITRLAVNCACCRSMQAGAGCQQLIRKALQLGDAAPKQRSRAGNLITQWGVVLMAVSEEAGSDPAADLWMCCQLLLLLACLCQLGLVSAGRSMAYSLSHSATPACLQACFHLHCQNLDSRQQGPTQCLQSIFWVSWVLLSTCRPLSGPVTLGLSCSCWHCTHPGPGDMWDWLIHLPGWEGGCRVVSLW